MARWRELPHDVLLIIAGHLPAQSVDALAAIDWFFLNLVLPRRYEQVTIDRYDRRMKRFMKTRLRCVHVPFVLAHLDSLLGPVRLVTGSSPRSCAAST
jgi:hypothetical protein